jgi:hypothetical protein
MGKHATVVKTQYSNRAKGGTGRAHAAVDYYGTRPDKDGKEIERQGFDRLEDKLTLESLHKAVDEAQGKFDNRIILSPDPETSQAWNPQEWREWTRETLDGLHERHGEMPWTAVKHDDPEHPHVHVWANTEHKLYRAELEGLRERGDQAAERLQERQQTLERDPMHEPGRDPAPTRERESSLQISLDR